MKKLLIGTLLILSCYTDAMTCYKSIKIDTFEGKGLQASRFVTRINGQLFYKSTGLNSSTAGIYFPFYGIFSNESNPFWFIKPGHGKIEVNGKLINTKSGSQIWDSYKYSELGTFMKSHNAEYIEEKLYNSEAQLRFAGYDTAEVSYRIVDSNFSGNLKNEFIAELNSYFLYQTNIQKNITVNVDRPIKSFISSYPATIKSYELLADDINNYIANATDDWSISNQGCCEIY